MSNNFRTVLLRLFDHVRHRAARWFESEPTRQGRTQTGDNDFRGSKNRRFADRCNISIIEAATVLRAACATHGAHGGFDTIDNSVRINTYARRTVDSIV